eukprot:5683258-Pyramimonas_sp.AAC.1
MVSERVAGDPDADVKVGSTGVGSSEAEQWYVDRQTARNSATRSVNRPLFWAMMRISMIAKGPLMHWMRWHQK